MLSFVVETFVHNISHSGHAHHMPLIISDIFQSNAAVGVCLFCLPERVSVTVTGTDL